MSAPQPVLGALVRATVVLAVRLALQAVSLELVRQATLGFDWEAALRSPAPYVSAIGALVGIAAAGRAPSSDRRIRPGPKERPVEGRSSAEALVKIAP